MEEKQTDDKQPITGEMTIKEVVDKYPQTMAVFMEHNLHCVGCHISEFETVAQGAAGHGIDTKELVKDLNKAATEPPKEDNNKNNED